MDIFQFSSLCIFKTGVCVAETPKYSLLTFILLRFLGPNVRLICATKCTAQ